MLHFCNILPLVLSRLQINAYFCKRKEYLRLRALPGNAGSVSKERQLSESDKTNDKTNEDKTIQTQFLLMKNSTLILSAVMAVTATAVKAQALQVPALKRTHPASLVMKADKPALKLAPGVKAKAMPADALSRSLAARTAGASARLQQLRARAVKKAARSAETPKVWASAQETAYVMDEDTEQWTVDTQNKYEYNDKALVARVYSTGSSTDDSGNAETTYLRTDYNYDADGRQTEQILYSSLDGTDYTASTKLVRSYDPVQPTLYTFFGYYSWNELQGKWELTSQANKYTYTRDADNNIVKMVISAPYQGQWEDIHRCTNTVDPATKQINTFLYEKQAYDENDNLYWETDQHYTDLKWEKTNGQVGSEYENDPSTNWMVDGNYLKSATVCSTTDGTPEGAINIVYGTGGSYTETKTYVYKEDYMGQTYTLNCKDVFDVTYTDGNGSFNLEYKSWGDYAGDGNYDLRQGRTAGHRPGVRPARGQRRRR